MIILGISAYHGDSAAVIIVNGNVIAAIEEERLNRVKHWAGFPIESISYCLEAAKVDISEVDYISINRDPKAAFFKKILFLLRNKVPFSFIKDRLKNKKSIESVGQILAEKFDANADALQKKVKYVEHHISHLASSYYMSSFKNSDLISIDGTGDWTCTMMATSKNNEIIPIKRIYFPNSMGVFYTAMTQFLGFPHYGDEYKVMGLSPYGEPRFMDEMREVVKSTSDGLYELNYEYFIHQQRRKSSSWEGGVPTIDTLFSQKLEELFFPARNSEDELQQIHKDFAASVQLRYEEVVLDMVNSLQKKTGSDSICISGGCAMNSVANGKILTSSNYKNVFVPPQPGDAGGALGAAAYTYVHESGNKMNFDPMQAYRGPSYENDSFIGEIKEKISNFENITIEEISDSNNLCRMVASEISKGGVIGWFQGGMEWGPRALGNRSILADPRRADMKDILNLKIKRRESFRPFAPSITIENVGEYFETNYHVPYMSMVFQVKNEKREILPAVTHVNGSGRLQTVDKKENNIYWTLIKEFEKITGIPVLLNTSFNENEPIVCKPLEALDCFLRTKMDVLVINNFIIKRN